MLGSAAKLFLAFIRPRSGRIVPDAPEPVGGDHESIARVYECLSSYSLYSANESWQLSTLHSNSNLYSSCRPFNRLRSTTNENTELHLDGFGNHDDLGKMHQILKNPTTFLFPALNVKSLTIDFLPSHFPMEKSWPPTWPTTFAALLKGCQRPPLSLLHLRNFSFREAKFSTFIQ